MGNKDQLTKTMLDLFRNAYRCTNVETALITLSEIWELYAQQFPQILSKITRKPVTSERIRLRVSDTIRNTGVVKEKTQDNIYQKIGYLYNQRCIVAHKSIDEPFDKECIMMAFDLTRCLILKLFYIKDKTIEEVVKKIVCCDREKAAYPVDSVRYTPVSDVLMRRIFK